MNSSIGDPLKKIKVGVIGAGRWGKKHVDEYSKMKNVGLLWVSDLRKENLAFCQDKYNVPCVSQDYHDVLSSDVDAVSVCTLNETHFDICRDALKAGKHVLVEKPLTINSKEAYKLVNIAKDADRLLAVGHIFRFNNAIVEAKKYVKENFVDDLFYLRLQWTDFVYPEQVKEIIFDMMPHAFDVMNFILDSWPKKITCFAEGFRKKELEDTAHIICEFPNRILTHTETSWTLPEKSRQIDVVGRSHCLKIDCLNQKVKIFYEGKLKGELSVQPNNTLHDELVHFLDAIGKGSFLSNDGETGAKVVELLEQSRKSLEKGKTIVI